MTVHGWTDLWIDLKCHPSKGSAPVRAVQARVRRSAASEIQVGFRLDGDTSRIRVPAPREPRFATDLWRHTCFEIFIASEHHPQYYEFNFSPSGEWAVYAFAGYRDGGPLAEESLPPRIAVRSTDSRLELDSLVRLDNLSAISSHTSLRVGLSAVVETTAGFSYWALHHPADKPDFHHADGLALLLEPPSREQ